jgi:hypothetical protein
LVISAGFDRSLTYFTVEEGSIFRRVFISQRAHPVTIAVHPSGFMIAAALSSGEVALLDAISAERLVSFDPLARIVTSVAFHQSDLLVASCSGVVMRWKTPEKLHTEL